MSLNLNQEEIRVGMLGDVTGPTLFTINSWLADVITTSSLWMCLKRNSHKKTG